jgi:hypothetical protein
MLVRSLLNQAAHRDLPYPARAIYPRLPPFGIICAGVHQRYAPLQELSAR